MAIGNKYICATCGIEYEFCPKCVVTKPSYDAERYCSQAHEDIFKILSKNGCNLATAEETLKALEGYDTTNLKKSIKKHIDSLQPKKAEVEEKTEAKAEVKEYEAPKKSVFRKE